MTLPYLPIGLANGTDAWSRFHRAFVHQRQTIGTALATPATKVHGRRSRMFAQKGPNPSDYPNPLPERDPPSLSPSELDGSATGTRAIRQTGLMEE